MIEELTSRQAENVQSWIKSLRSGSYKQGQYGLRRESDYFCCLGVACDVADPKLWDFNSRASVKCGSVPYCGLEDLPPTEFMNNTYGVSINEIKIP